MFSFVNGVYEVRTCGNRLKFFYKRLVAMLELEQQNDAIL